MSAPGPSHPGAADRPWWRTVLFCCGGEGWYAPGATSSPGGGETKASGLWPGDSVCWKPLYTERGVAALTFINGHNKGDPKAP